MSTIAAIQAKIDAIPDAPDSIDDIHLISVYNAIKDYLSNQESASVDADTFKGFNIDKFLKFTSAKGLTYPPNNGNSLDFIDQTMFTWADTPTIGKPDVNGFVQHFNSLTNNYALQFYTPVSKNYFLTRRKFGGNFTDWIKYKPIKSSIDITASQTIHSQHNNKTLLYKGNPNITLSVKAANTFGVLEKDDEIDIIRVASGTVKIVGVNGVNIFSKGSKKNIAENTAATLRYLGANEWLLIGDLY